MWLTPRAAPAEPEPALRSGSRIRVLPGWNREAEGEGFEPSIRLTTDNGFRALRDFRLNWLVQANMGGVGRRARRSARRSRADDQHACSAHAPPLARAGDDLRLGQCSGMTPERARRQPGSSSKDDVARPRRLQDLADTPVGGLQDGTRAPRGSDHGWLSQDGAGLSGMEIPDWSWLRALQDRQSQFAESAAGRYWAHLSTADFMNSSFAFAALAVLSAFPFLAVSSSVIGGDNQENDRRSDGLECPGYARCERPDLDG